MPAIAICILGHAILTTAPGGGLAGFGLGLMMLGVIMSFLGY